ncbi:MAG: gamma-glutamyl-gamma-aminobutyrate hydrolase family protein [Microbacterium sp.]
MAERRIAVVHLRDARPHAPAYQELVDRLNVSALRTIEELGWRAEMIAASDVGVAAAVAAARRSELVVVMGGEDIHPRFYDGELEYPGSGLHDEQGDEAQLAVVADAAERGTPLLGICRGNQLINVAFGGDLVQHLPTTHAHRGPVLGSRRFVEHGLRGIDAELAEAVRADEPVQSSHHQAPGRIGDGLRVAATAEDGVIEAVIHETAPVVGVQWHPEFEASRPGQLSRLLRLIESRIA